MEEVGKLQVYQPAQLPPTPTTINTMLCESLIRSRIFLSRQQICRRINMQSTQQLGFPIIHIKMKNLCNTLHDNWRYGLVKCAIFILEMMRLIVLPNLLTKSIPL